MSDDERWYGCLNSEKKKNVSSTVSSPPPPPPPSSSSFFVTWCFVPKIQILFVEWYSRRTLSLNIAALVFFSSSDNNRFNGGQSFEPMGEIVLRWTDWFDTFFPCPGCTAFADTSTLQTQNNRHPKMRKQLIFSFFLFCSFSSMYYMISNGKSWEWERERGKTNDEFVSLPLPNLSWTSTIG